MIELKHTHTLGTRNALHGQVETRRDRWWDKLQLIVGDDATTMFQFEHSHSDGAAWNYWLEGVVRSVLEYIMLMSIVSLTRTHAYQRSNTGTRRRER